MTQQVHNTVFISYRRSTSSYLARAIYMDLKAHGYDVFMDVQSIDSGQFDEIILRQIEARAHFLLLCTPGTFDRINDPGDWLRREIEHAMLHNRNIVPIMASDFKFDAVTTQRFAGKLAELPRYNALNAPHDYFEEALERLRTRFLRLLIGVTIAATPTADVKAVATKKAEVERQPKPSHKQLSAEEYLLRGIALQERGDNDGAIAEYNKVLLLNPQDANAYFNRGNAHHANNDYKEAISDFTEAIRLNPQHVEAYHNRGLARTLKGDSSDAIADYTQAIGLNAHYSEAYFYRGNAYSRNGDYDDAIADYTKAIRLDPDDSSTYRNRGIARELTGDRNGAIADYTEAIRLNPQETYPYFGRGNAYKQKGDNRLALEDFLHYIDNTRANPDPTLLPEAEKHIRELKKKLRIK